MAAASSRAMVLLDNVVELFDLAHKDRHGSAGRLYLRAIFSIGGKKRIAGRSIAEWSNATPRSSIISSRHR